MANDIDRTSPHYKGDFGSIYEVNKKFPTGGVAGDFVVIEGWAHYWNADRATWCVNAERDSYWDELITNIIEKFKLVRGATYMGVASLDTVPAKVIGAKMYYFATVAGTYKNFGDLVVPQGINVLYSENGISWVNTTLLEVAQELGVSTKKVVSQKALNDALNLKANQSSVNEALAKKANTADVDTKFTEEKKRVDGELDKKFDKESVVQESGEAEDKVMSQKAVSEKLSDLSVDVAEVHEDVLNSIYKNGADADLDLTDTKGNVLLRLQNGHIKTKYFDSEDPVDVDVLDDKSDADLDLTDTKGNVLLRLQNGHIKTKYFDSANIDASDIVLLNKDKESVLYAMAYNYPSYSIAPKPENKRPVIAWLSDIHGYEKQYKRFIEYINKYSDVIDLAVITGDINKLAPNDGGFDNTYKKYFKESKVPVILCLGNHDITDNPETGAILDTITELDDIYINPYKGTLGIVKGDGCYFYKDINVANNNYRFISINEYEFPRLVADGSWETIAYKDLPSYNASTTYAKGDEINLNNHSYKAIKTIVGVEPNRTYKYPPTRRFISQTQADWLVNVLNSTPEGFHIIFMTHQEIEPFERNHNSAFQCPNSRDDYAIGQNGNVILDIVEAFSKRQNINKTYKMTIPSADEVDGFDIVVESSFADAKAKVRCFLSGHSHCDEVGMTKSLSTSIPVLKITEGGTLWTTDDLIRLGSKSFDAFNILSFTDTSIRIMRVGCDVSSDLQDRKYELIKK